MHTTHPNSCKRNKQVNLVDWKRSILPAVYGFVVVGGGGGGCGEMFPPLADFLFGRYHNKTAPAYLYRLRRTRVGRELGRLGK